MSHSNLTLHYLTSINQLHSSRFHLLRLSDRPITLWLPHLVYHCMHVTIIQQCGRC